MHIKIIAATMIAALLLAGGSMVAPVPAEPRLAEPAATTQPARELPTAQDAQDAALAHAGLTAQQVTGLHTEVDYENGIMEFEVEFYHGDWEYDYTFNAQTLEILKSHKEYDPPKAPPASSSAQTKQAETIPPETQPVQTPPAETKPAEAKPAETKPAETKKLTADEAKAIALNHAGFSAGQVKGLRAEYDRDDGRPEYDVEFRVGSWEYEYEIHAETGKILSWDKEYDD